MGAAAEWTQWVQSFPPTGKVAVCGQELLTVNHSRSIAFPLLPTDAPVAERAFLNLDGCSRTTILRPLLRSPQIRSSCPTRAPRRLGRQHDLGRGLAGRSVDRCISSA